MSAVATPCHSAQGKHSLQIQPARDGEVGWRGEGRWAERDLAGDVKQNASFSLFLFHFFPPSVSAEFSPHSLSASWPPLLFSPSHMWWKPCPAPIRASTSPTVSPLLSCPLPFLFSPFLKYIQCWHGQIARLGRDDGHHRAFRRGGGVKLQWRRSGAESEHRYGKIIFWGGSVPPTCSPHNMRMTLLFRPF